MLSGSLGPQRISGHGYKRSRKVGVVIPLPVVVGGLIPFPVGGWGGSMNPSPLLCGRHWKKNINIIVVCECLSYCVCVCARLRVCLFAFMLINQFQFKSPLRGSSVPNGLGRGLGWGWAAAAPRGHGSQVHVVPLACDGGCYHDLLHTDTHTHRHWHALSLIDLHAHTLTYTH